MAIKKRGGEDKQSYLAELKDAGRGAMEVGDMEKGGGMRRQVAPLTPTPENSLSYTPSVRFIVFRSYVPVVVVPPFSTNGLRFRSPNPVSSSRLKSPEKPSRSFIFFCWHNLYTRHRSSKVNVKTIRPQGQQRGRHRGSLGTVGIWEVVSHALREKSGVW